MDEVGETIDALTLAAEGDTITGEGSDGEGDWDEGSALPSFPPMPSFVSVVPVLTISLPVVLIIGAPLGVN